MRHMPRGLSSTILLLAVPAATAAAQSRRAQVLHPDPPPARGQLGGMAPAPTPRADDARGWDDRGREHGDHYYDGYDGDGDRDHHRRGDHRVPTIVTSDGRVFADFGNGYQQVLRSCAAAYGAAAQGQAYTTPSYTTPTYSLPNYGAQQPIPFTPPVPAQQTESQKMIAEQQQAGAAAQAAQAACWTTDAQGRIVVVGQ